MIHTYPSRCAEVGMSARPATNSFSHINAAIKAERDSFALADRMERLADLADDANLPDVAAGYRRGARAEMAAGRAATARYRPGPSTFDGPQPRLLPGQMRLGDA